jgi:hypothetical protein
MCTWAARFKTMLSLSQRHGLIGKAAMTGVVGGVVAVVIGVFPTVHAALKALGLLSYVFLAALGGACGMVLSLIAHACCTRLRSSTPAQGREEEER